jgi:hypothetical protein
LDVCDMLLPEMGLVTLGAEIGHASWMSQWTQGDHVPIPKMVLNAPVDSGVGWYQTGSCNL